MGLRRLDLRGFTGGQRELAAVLPRPVDEQDRSSDQVAAIIAEVRAGGDAALRALTARFDQVDVDELLVPAAEIQAALGRIPVALQDALDVAHDRVLAYHAHEAAGPAGDFASGGITVRHLVRPVSRAGCYAPGGRARYPSTVIMCAVPAQVAGVEEIVLCVPPGPDGRVDDATLAAAAVAGVTEVYRVGGAQAVAAMAFGTESIRAVDVVVGPGNRYVAEAKRQVSGVVGIASAFAGPSEVVVIAGPDTPPELAAIDLVVQAEHGPDGLAWLITWSEEVADAVADEVERIVERSPRRSDLEATLGTGGYVVLVDGARQACAVSNVVAPEHLEILTGDAVVAARAGHLGRRGVPRRECTGQCRGLPGGAQPCAPHQPNGALRERTSCRRLPQAHPRGLRRRRCAGDPRPLCGDPGGDRGPALPRRVGATEMAGLAGESPGTGPGDPVPPAPESAARPLPPVRPDLRALTGYHSAQVEVEVRLNTNESPLPPPLEWYEALAAGIAGIEFNRYPDREAVALRSALAESHGVDADRVFCANGSNEVLQCLFLAYGGPGRTAALFEPTYTLHRHIARITGTEVAAGARRDDFALDLDEVRRVIGDSEPVLTFLCSPNNPTGRADLPEEIAEVASLAPGLLVVDEAYGQFAPSSALDLFRDGGAGAERTVVVRTFSKTWSMAATRLGYLVAAPEVVRACEQVVLPYHLDAAKQLAGRLALEHVPEMERRVALVAEERGRIAAAFAALPVETWPSDANFLLFRPTAKNARAVWSDLVEASVLVRDCSEWPGLTGCLRVTVGLPAENDRFLAALTESLR